MISARGLLQLPHAPGNFLRRRIIRIVPLYWILTAVKLAIITYRPQLSEHMRSTTWNIVSSFLFIPLYRPQGRDSSAYSARLDPVFRDDFLHLVCLWPGDEARSGAVRHAGHFWVLALVGAFRPASWPAWTAVAVPIVLEFLAGIWDRGVRVGCPAARGEWLPAWEWCLAFWA